MAANSTIEWTDSTWNPVRGCEPISPGCKNCYAKTFAERFRGTKGHAYEQGFDFRLVPNKLLDSLRWTKPRMIFVNSMSDLFQAKVSNAFIQDAARIMQAGNWHTYQVLTKRSERMRDMLQTSLGAAADVPHIWWGVSVEDQKYGLPRIEHLREAPAKVRFLSIEPLLEDLGKLNLDGIHWVIVGGESGRRARPMDPNWVRSIRDQCAQAQVPFFFKQWGGVRKKKKGRELDGRFYNEYPARTSNPVPSLKERRLLIEGLRLPLPLVY
jgi:protein gp37